MGELGVDGAGDHLGVDGLELVHAVAESDDLSGADERAAEDGNQKKTHLHEERMHLVCATTRAER